MIFKPLVFNDIIYGVVSGSVPGNSFWRDHGAE